MKSGSVPEGVDAAPSSGAPASSGVPLSSADADELRKFLSDRIGSIDHLRILHLLASSRDEWWAPRRVAEQLDITDSVAEDALDELLQGQLVLGKPAFPRRQFRYGPDERLEALVQRALAAYSEERLDVLKILTSRSITRMRLRLSWFTERLRRQ